MFFSKFPIQIIYTKQVQLLAADLYSEKVLQPAKLLENPAAYQKTVRHAHSSLAHSRAIWCQHCHLRNRQLWEGCGKQAKLTPVKLSQNSSFFSWVSFSTKTSCESALHTSCSETCRHVAAQRLISLWAHISWFNVSENNWNTCLAEYCCRR